jgi:hypothetical protein
VRWAVHGDVSGVEVLLLLGIEEGVRDLVHFRVGQHARVSAHAVDEINPVVSSVCRVGYFLLSLAAASSAGVGQNLRRGSHRGHVGVESTSDSHPQRVLAVESSAVQKSAKKHINVVAVADLASLAGVVDRIPHGVVFVSVMAGVEGTSPRSIKWQPFLLDFPAKAVENDSVNSGRHLA